MAQKENRHKVRAILAGGLVLGIGAAVTFATWNDSEFAKGSFTSGGFYLEGSSTDAEPDGAADGFGDHNSPDVAAALTFTSPDLAGNLAPGDSVSAPFAVRLAKGSTVNADVVLKSAAILDEGVWTGLTYSVVLTEGFGCTAPIIGRSIVTSAQIDSVQESESFELLHAQNKTTDGLPVNLCFTVTAGEQADLISNATSVVTWQLTAISK